MTPSFRVWIPAIALASFIVAAFSAFRSRVSTDIVAVVQTGSMSGEEPFGHIFASGWPFDAFTATAYEQAYPPGITHCGPTVYVRVVGGDNLSPPRAYIHSIVPRQLHPWAAAGNLIVQGILLALGLIGLPELAIRGLRSEMRKERKNRGLCVGCGYPRVGTEQPCPECGKLPTTPQ